MHNQERHDRFILLRSLGMDSKQPHRTSIAVSSVFKRFLAVKKIISGAHPLLSDHFAFSRNPKPKPGIHNFPRFQHDKKSNLKSYHFLPTFCQPRFSGWEP